MNSKKRQYLWAGIICNIVGFIFFGGMCLSVHLGDLGNAIIRIVPTFILFQAGAFCLIIAKFDWFKKILDAEKP